MWLCFKHDEVRGKSKLIAAHFFRLIERVDKLNAENDVMVQHERKLMTVKNGRHKRETLVLSNEVVGRYATYEEVLSSTFWKGSGTVCTKKCL